MVRILNRTGKNMFVLNFFLYILTKLIAYSVKRWNIVSIPILFWTSNCTELFIRHSWSTKSICSDLSDNYISD